MSKNLAKLIAAHKTEGIRVGEGFFSLGHEEALRKVAQFGLESPEKGLLRIVQLAVSAGCKSVNIKLTRNEVQLLVDDLHPDDLGLYDLPKELQLDVNNFGLALLSCLHSGFERGTIAERRVSWRFDKDGFQSAGERDEPPRKVFLELQRAQERGFWNQLKSFLNRRCLDYVTLSRLLAHCPVKVTIDGKELSRDERPTLGKCLCEVYLEGPADLKTLSVARPPSRVTRYLVKGKHREKGGWRWRTLESITAGARMNLFSKDGSGTYSIRNTNRDSALMAHLWIPASPRKTEVGQIEVVRNGVVIGAVVPEFAFPLYGVVGGDYLDTDLSGLELVNNKKTQKLMRYIYALVDKRLRQLAKLPIAGKYQRLLASAGYTVQAKKSEEAKKDPKVLVRRASQVKTYNHRRERNEFRTQRRHLRDQGRF